MRAQSFRGLLIAALTLSVSSGVVFAGPLEDGQAAYDRRDYATALQLWRPLAVQGNAVAQANLGSMYINGEGVAQDYKEAVRWYRLAAVKGQARAQYNVGWFYANGEGVEQDFKEAVKWYRLAAAQGHEKAQLNLGVMYQVGQGVAQDFVRAHMWFNIAAAQGNADAVRLGDTISAFMTARQIAEAQEVARKCKESNYKECD
jgi:TPR repeat protein